MILDKSVFSKHMPICMIHCKPIQRSLCIRVQEFLDVVVGDVKARYGWSDKSFSSLLQVVHDMLPEENTLPKSYYQEKKILCPMGMEY